MSVKREAPALPQRVLLTGASRGIGAAIARALIAQGARIAAVARSRDSLFPLFGTASHHALLECDLARTDRVEACVDRAADEVGGLDAFVSCAGIVEYAGLGAISHDALQRQLAVNLIAPLLMAQRAADIMRADGKGNGGSMLFIASTLGIKPAPLTTAYAASKAALISVTRSLALELAPHSIRVNAIAPGVVETDMLDVVRTVPGEAPPAAVDVERRLAEQRETLRALHPLGRLGRPEEIAETALYLLRAPFVTGAVVTVDGGLLLGAGAV
jgi:NAD(P)-dependent dehydrogenase (short-subunit alcohol dehydrogenase family)